jgi:excisionase family DNA binding protein
VTPRDRLLGSLAPELVAALEDLVAERVQVELAAVAAPATERMWLTLEEAAERLGISADAVRMRVNRGRLEARRHGRRLYVSAASVDRLGRGEYDEC